MARYFEHPKSGKVIYADNATQPKRSKPTWDIKRVNILHPDTPIETDTGVTIKPDAVQHSVRGEYESRWGKYIYFQIDGSWYKIHVGTHDKTCDNPWCDTHDGYSSNFNLQPCRGWASPGFEGEVGGIP